MIKKLFLIPLLTLGIIFSSYGLIQTNANNHGNIVDVAFSFLFGTGGHPYTGARNKENKSYVYMKASRITGPGAYRAHVRHFNLTDVSGGYSSVVRPGVETFIANMAVERFGPNTMIRVMGEGSGNFNASGVWSPDSIGGPN